MVTLPPGTPMARRAFSLVEMMAVLAILGIAMMFVAINIGALTPSTRLTSAGRYVTSMIYQARDEAVISGHSIGIGYDLEDHTVWLDIPTAMLEDAEDYDEEGRIRLRAKELRDVEIRSVQLDAQREYTSGDVVLNFSPLGVAPAHIVHLHSPLVDQDVWLQVSPLTGEVLMRYSGDEAFEHRPEPLEFEELTDASFPR